MTEGAEVLSEAQKISGQIQELESLGKAIRDGAETDFFNVF